MKIFHIIGLLIAMLGSQTFGQSTLFLYDQASTVATNESSGLFDSSLLFSRSPFQSFTPTLSTVGFVRFVIAGDVQSGPLYVNIRSNGINGPIIGTSQPITFSVNSLGASNFLFASPVSVVPGSVYFFQLIQTLPTGLSGVSYGQYGYAGGSAYESQGIIPNYDLAFQEGIIVP
ncbi:MAG: hypothetical protein RLZZ350_579, partial [Verrucomicrobiota bacterium]